MAHTCILLKRVKCVGYPKNDCLKIRNPDTKPNNDANIENIVFNPQIDKNISR